MNILRLALLTALLLLLTACSTTSDKAGNGDQPFTAKQLYVSGEQAMANESFDLAVKKFEALLAQYPYGQFAQQAQMDLIYAYYRADDHPAAAAAAEHFIHLYPRARHVDYAYYMLGVANAEQQKSMLTRYLPLDPALRDISTAKEAYSNFEALISRFPRSKYVADAKQRMIYLRNVFAQKELHAANYYYERGAYVAAANRASYLVQTYSQAPQVEQALVVMVNANRKLGLARPARDALIVLKANYPESYEKLKG